MFFKYIQSKLINTSQKSEIGGAPFCFPDSFNFRLPNILLPQLFNPVNNINIQNIIGCLKSKSVIEEPISPFSSNSTEFKGDCIYSAQSSQGYIKKHKKKASKKVTDCPHKNEPHYAKVNKFF